MSAFLKPLRWGKNGVVVAGMGGNRCQKWRMFVKKRANNFAPRKFAALVSKFNVDFDRPIKYNLSL